MGKKAEQDSSFRVTRGGSGSDPPARALVAGRAWFGPGYQYDGLGFRLVRHRSALERLVESLGEVSDAHAG